MKHYNYSFLVILFTLIVSFSAQGSDITISNVEEGKLKTLVDALETNYSNITSLILDGGKMNNADFQFIKTNLTNVTRIEMKGSLSAPDGKVPDYAFDNLRKLNEFKCSSPLITELGNNVLSGVPLVTVNFPEIVIIGDNAFQSCSKLVSISFPKAKTIKNYSFQGCASLTLVSLPEVQSIDSWAFGGNAGITDILLPKVETIGANAFRTCRSLRAVMLPKVKTIESSAFWSCIDVVSVSLPVATSIANAAFYGCSNLTSLALPQVTSIGDQAFYNCSDLVNLSLPQANTIGASAFNRCTSLESITLPSATFIQMSAFESCSKLANVSLPVVATIGNSVFRSCSSLPAIHLPKAETMGESVFYGCIKLTTVSFPAAISIGASTFYSCSGLTSVFLPEAISVGGKAFAGCTALKNISMPAAISIGGETFSGCSNLLAVGLPSVMTIGDAAFANCKSLTTIALGETEPAFGIGIYNVTTNKPIILTPAVSWGKNEVQGIPIVYNAHLAGFQKAAFYTRIHFVNEIPNTSSFSWYKDDVTLPGNTNSYAIASAQENDNGWYTMSFVHDNDGVTRWLPEIMIEVGGNQSSIDKINSISLLSLYPNPVMDELRIQSDSEQILNVRIFNVNGQQVEQYNLPSGASSISISASGWTKGVYVVQMKTNNSTVVRKVIKR